MVMRLMPNVRFKIPPRLAEREQYVRIIRTPNMLSGIIKCTMKCTHTANQSNCILHFVEKR